MTRRPRAGARAPIKSIQKLNDRRRGHLLYRRGEAPAED